MNLLAWVDLPEACKAAFAAQATFTDVAMAVHNVPIWQHQPLQDIMTSSEQDHSQ